jgi:hypothetical protein
MDELERNFTNIKDLINIYESEVEPVNRNERDRESANINI